MWQLFKKITVVSLQNTIVSGQLTITFDKSEKACCHIFYTEIFLNLISKLCQCWQLQEITLKYMKLGNVSTTCTLKYTDLQEIAKRLGIGGKMKDSNIQRLARDLKQAAHIFQAARDLIYPYIQDLQLNSMDFCTERKNHNSFADKIILDVVCNALLKTYIASIAKVYPAQWDNPDGVILMCYTKTDIDETLPLVFRGFTIKYLKMHTVSNETVKVEESLKYNNILDEFYYAKLHLLKSTISMYAKRLMESHSNLEGIGASIFMSTKHGVVVPLNIRSFQPTPCIVLFCGRKSYIPYGEDVFPRELNGPKNDMCFPVDVQEGWFINCNSPVNQSSSIMKPNSLKPYDQLVMGCCFSQHGGSALATLGPFLSIRNTEGSEEVGVLTVAHAFDNRWGVITVVQPGNDSSVPNVRDTQHEREFGQIFTTIDNNEVDAALLLVNNRIPKRLTFIDMDENDKLNLDIAGMLTRFPNDYNGEIMEIKNAIDHTILKVGSRTGFTVGQLVLSGTSVKQCGFYGAVMRNGTYVQKILNDQIFVRSYADHSFLHCGDSGSAVFAYDRRDNKLICIGMAVGYIGDINTCKYGVITPIQTILSYFNRMPNITVQMKQLWQPMEIE